ncbi:hypothetical protein AAFF_G00163170 [Aldrovandia affinis]|uniref:Uncharacterized protein n=1 Tax=Aldrovandia affinis TaxID=143900 RepID=A0AAD7WX43_9TELE|nr:hypothetical protein AAFF_G00163170 [Aldrovandia affinis]
MAAVQLIKELPGAGGVLEREAEALCRERDTDQEPRSRGTEQVQATQRLHLLHAACIPGGDRTVTHGSSGHPADPTCCCWAGPLDRQACRHLTSRNGYALRRRGAGGPHTDR